MSLSTIPEALEALRAGRPVLVADDENRENEGDVILSAELATPEWVAWTVRWSSGFICAPMPADLADSLNLPPMVAASEDARSTAYTVSAVSPSSGSGTEEGHWFEISLIPETLAATTLGTRVVGDRVNLETDILARHVERLLAFRAATTVAPEGGSR